MESIAPNLSSLEPVPTGNLPMNLRWFRGSVREVFLGRILTPKVSANDWPHAPIRRQSENCVESVIAGSLHLQFQNGCGGGAGS
jgi:hypothetical protein